MTVRLVISFNPSHRSPIYSTNLKKTSRISQGGARQPRRGLRSGTAEKARSKRWGFWTGPAPFEWLARTGKAIGCRKIVLNENLSRTTPVGIRSTSQDLPREVPDPSHQSNRSRRLCFFWLSWVLASRFRRRLPAVGLVFFLFLAGSRHSSSI